MKNINLVQAAQKDPDASILYAAAALRRRRLRRWPFLRAS